MVAKKWRLWTGMGDGLSCIRLIGGIILSNPWRLLSGLFGRMWGGKRPVFGLHLFKTV